MAICNFMSANCTRYFVIGMNRYFTKEDVKECDLDPELEGEYDELGTETDYEFAKQNIVFGLQKKGWEDFDGYEDNAHVIAYKTAALNYGGCEISLEINALVRSGYYEGACKDLSGKVTIDSGGDYWTGSPEYDMFEDFNELYVTEDSWTGKAGLDHLQAKNIIKKLNSIIGELKNEAEYVFSCGCESELYQTYRCDNGETGYGKMQKRLYQEIDEAKQNKAA